MHNRWGGGGMAYAVDLKSTGGNPMRVRYPPAPHTMVAFLVLAVSILFAAPSIPVNLASDNLLRLALGFMAGYILLGALFQSAR